MGVIFFSLTCNQQNQGGWGECHFLYQRYKKTEQCWSYEDISAGVITTNMRTLMLLMLTAVAVTGLKRHAVEEILLKEIMESVEGMLKSSNMVRTETISSDSEEPKKC